MKGTKKGICYYVYRFIYLVIRFILYTNTERRRREGERGRHTERWTDRGREIYIEREGE